MLIGANNSGKSNLLAGINHFSKLVSRAFPENAREKTITSHDFFPHRHSLSGEKVPMTFSCSWKKDIYTLEYELILIPDMTKNGKEVSCQEKLKVSHNNHTTNEFTHGYDSVSSSMLLRTTIDEKGIEKKLLRVIELFFRSLSFAFYYNLQSSFLKGIALPFKYDYSRQDFMAV